MKKTVLLFISFFYFSNVFAQNTIDTLYPKNTLFFEVGGRGGLYSVNYERILHNTEIIKYNQSVGLSILPGNSYKRRQTIQPNFVLTSGLIIGKQQHHLEIGVGVTMVAGYFADLIPGDSLTNKTPFVYQIYPGYSGIVGYRYQKANSKFMFRAGYIPIYISKYSEFDHWFGISFGFSFNTLKDFKE